MKNVKMVIGILLLVSQGVLAEETPVETTLNVIKSVTQALSVGGSVDLAQQSVHRAMNAYYAYQNKVDHIQGLQNLLTNKKMELNNQQAVVAMLEAIPAEARTEVINTTIASARALNATLTAEIKTTQSGIETLQNNP